MPDAVCEVRCDQQGRIEAAFDAPQWAPTPGQYLVLYDGDVCIGGGVIDTSLMVPIAGGPNIEAALHAG